MLTTAILENGSRCVCDEDLNFVPTDGTIGRKRRFPGFIIKRLPNGNLKAFDDDGQLRAGSPTMDGLQRLLTGGPDDKNT